MYVYVCIYACTYRVCSAYDHYQDWSGNGIKSVNIKERTPGFVHAQYTTGVFGITFQFEIYWSHVAPTKVMFRTVTPTRLIHLSECHACLILVMCFCVCVCVCV